MSEGRTITPADGRTFDANKDERLKIRPERAAELLKRAMIAAGTCVTRFAFRMGMSEAYARKLRAGDAQLDLRDLVGMAEHEPETFDEVVDSLAALRSKVVVDRLVGVAAGDRMGRAALVVKESGEAVSATVQAAATRRADDRTRAIAELKESIATQMTELLTLEAEEKSDRDAARRPLTTRSAS